MLTILGSPQQVCQGATRRQTLQAAGLGLFGVDPELRITDTQGQPVPLVEEAGRPITALF